MDEDRILRRLAAAGSKDAAPDIDVVDRVMRDVNRLREPSMRVLWAFTAAAAAAAVVVAILAIQSIPPDPDPIMQVMGGMMR
jgi:hypothetical protein